MLVDLIGLKQMHSTTRYHKETAALQVMLTLVVVMMSPHLLSIHKSSIIQPLASYQAEKKLSVHSYPWFMMGEVFPPSYHILVVLGLPPMNVAV